MPTYAKKFFLDKNLKIEYYYIEEIIYSVYKTGFTGNENVTVNTFTNESHTQIAAPGDTTGSPDSSLQGVSIPPSNLFGEAYDPNPPENELRSPDLFEMLCQAVCEGGANEASKAHQLSLEIKYNVKGEITYRNINHIDSVQ